jgi:hypothetical protein
MRRVLLVAVMPALALAAVYAQATRPEAAMARAARALIDSVDDGQRATLVWSFDDEERLNWNFVPTERQGLPWKAMSGVQRAAATTLLRTGLSAAGFTKAETIRKLEQVLFAQSGSAMRDVEAYYFTIFGEPGSARWGWRYEGHHLAQNWTIVDGRATATTPAFFGANPAHVQDGPMAGTRALGAEQDMAFALLDALTEAQRAKAVVAETAPRDIVTGSERRVAMLEPAGLAVSEMTDAQHALIRQLVELYASAQADALAADRLARVREAGVENIRFAWMGATTPGPGNAHYYRIQGPTFLIEYDNTQGGANHQHTVWRDFDGDFGGDLLALHYATAPHHQAAGTRR